MNSYQKRLFDSGWIDTEGKIRYPNDEATLQKMFREFLGAKIIRTFDECVTRAQDAVLLPEAKPDAANQRTNDEIEMARQALKQLSEEEKEAVCHLLYRTTELALFSTLVTLDQFPGGELLMQVDPGKRGGPNKVVTLNPYTNLHEDFHYWLDRFSQIGSEEENA